MAALQVIVLATLGAAGIGLGFVLPFRYCRNVPGFDTGLFFGALPILLAGLMCGHLFGGLNEEFLGTRLGVPVGMFLGCAVGTSVSALLAGSLGALISKFLA